MTISIWRYSHFVLALASSLFLVTASITGIILAVEPISHQAKGFAVHDLEEISLATVVDQLSSRYDDIFSLEVEASGFVKVSVLTQELETLDIYIDPLTGEQLGEVEKRPFIYKFATNLHRSLFLKSTGRFLVGLISFLLLLIAVSGVILLIKRQGGIRRVLSKVQKDYFELRYHVILSRWFLLPTIIISITGVFLSAEKFSLLPDEVLLYDEKKAGVPDSSVPLLFFQEITLDEVRKLEFPFSDEEDDYFQVALSDAEYRISQKTGQVLSSASYPMITLASRLSWTLHTGEGSVAWSIILMLASASILFFIYSGLTMSLKRRKRTPALSRMAAMSEGKYIILVGSETGTSYDFAKRLFNALSALGEKVHMTEMNNYDTFPNANHLIIVTSTYGEGDAPSNARKFKSKIGSVNQSKKIRYSTIGFGSLEYPSYCQFAEDVHNLLQEQDNFQQLLPLYKINEGDHSELEKWMNAFSMRLGISLAFETSPERLKENSKNKFQVISRSELNLDDTFTIRLRPKKRTSFVSGDLLSIFPKGTDRARQYSIAKLGKDILLSVKKHEFGKASSYLYTLTEGDIIEARVKENEHFHLPKDTISALLISNGTGIAPFLGMMNQKVEREVNLFWGGRSRRSIEIYTEILNEAQVHNGNLHMYTAYSRETDRQFVQDILKQEQAILLDTIQQGGVIMVCGSLAMQGDILDLIERVIAEHSDSTLEGLMKAGRVMMDCY